MKRIVLLVLAAFLCLGGLESRTEAAFEYKPVAFILLDYSGNASKDDFLSWREQARQAYYVPYYEIIKTYEPTEKALKIIAESGTRTSKLEKVTLQKIAAEVPAKVVVLLCVNQMDERLVHSRGFYWHDEGDLLQQVIASADMYVYKVENDRMLKNKLRHFEIEDIPISTSATEIIKYELRKLVNKMENREQI